MSRLTEWWRPKAGTIFSLLLLHLSVHRVPFHVGGPLLLFSVITLTGFGILGYFLNDWADIPFDRKVGKVNLVERITLAFRPLVLLALLAVTLVPWVVYFKVDDLSIGLIVGQLALQVAYPLPPVRLKRFPLVAMLVDAMYAFAIPAVLAWHTFDITTPVDNGQGQAVQFAFLLVWMLAMGLRHIINHHVSDRENDLLTGTANISLLTAPKQLRRWVQFWLFPVEWFGAFIFIGSWLYTDSWVPLVGVVMLVLAGAHHMVGSWPVFNVAFVRTALDRIASFWLGMAAVVTLIASDRYYALILVLFLLLFSDIFRHPLVAWTLGRCAKWPIEQASLMFNWGIYYFRKWFLRWPEKRNWGAHYEKRLLQLGDKKKSRNGIVAVFNQNYSKYTETFVSGHIKGLPYKVVFFHGWPSPMHFGEMESLISSNGFVRKTLSHVWSILDLNVAEMEDARIVRKLVHEKADLILAEFGTMGARCVSLSKKAGIPLVPIFYGYDAWHAKTLAECKDEYLEMFATSPVVFGVSKDICAQLVSLGCPAHKVKYLPCYVDLDQFAFCERTFDQPHFLSVGRFCHTKAPFITLMAFSQVVQQLPEARLTMVGNDDGGVLETVVSMIRAYGLQHNVELVGGCTPQQVRDHMCRASIFVQHSVTTPLSGDKEGTPVAVMEAMATGMPVIATRHAGIAEMIVHGETGLLVNEFDHVGMAREMIALASDRQRMMSMGTSAAESIRANRMVADHMGYLSAELASLIGR